MTASSHLPAFSFHLDQRCCQKRPGPPSLRVPRLARLLALAHKLKGQIGNGTICDYATLARLGQVSRARISQVMSLLLLAPDIQEEILFLPSSPNGRDPITLSRLLPGQHLLENAYGNGLWFTVNGDGTIIYPSSEDALLSLVQGNTLTVNAWI